MRGDGWEEERRCEQISERKVKRCPGLPEVSVVEVGEDRNSRISSIGGLLTCGTTGMLMCLSSMALYSKAIHFGTRRLFSLKPRTTLMMSGARREDWNSEVAAITVSTPLAVAIFMLSEPLLSASVEGEQCRV